MKSPALVLAAALLVPATARATDIDKYKPEIFEDPAKLEKKAEDFFELDEFKDVKEKKPKKMAVSEFTVSFITQSLRQKDIMVMGGAEEQNFDYGEEHKVRMTEALYKTFVDAMTAKGFEIVPRDQLVATSWYQAFAGQVDPKTKTAWGGPGHLGKGGTAAKIDVRSPGGLKDLVWSGDTEELNEENEARMIEALKIDGVFHVNVMVGVFHAEHAALEVGTKVSHRLGFKTKPNKKTGEIEYSYVDWGDAGLTTGLYMEDSVVLGKDKSGKGVWFKIDQDKFEASIYKMWNAVVKMAAVGM